MDNFSTYHIEKLFIPYMDKRVLSILYIDNLSTCGMYKNICVY